MSPHRSPVVRRAARWGLCAAAAVGGLLLAVNCAGLLTDYELPARAERPAGHHRGDPEELLRRPGEADPTYLRRLSDGIHRRMVVSRSVVERGHDRVALGDNWLLHLSGRIFPSHADYEFTDHRRALERGFGICTQYAALAFDILREQGYRRERVLWTPHTVTQAWDRAGRPWTIDAMHGIAMPHGIAEIRRRPAIVDAYYRDADPELAQMPEGWGQREVVSWARDVYSRRPFAVLSEVAYPRNSRLEPVFYVLKWAIPAALLLAAVPLVRRRRRAPLR